MRVSLQKKNGAAVFFDFRAVFPSLSHIYLMEVLSALALPTPVQNFIKALYDDNACVIAVSGEVFEGFPWQPECAKDAHYPRYYLRSSRTSFFVDYRA